jgi:hypothetical protein
MRLQIHRCKMIHCRWALVIDLSKELLLNFSILNVAELRCI